MKCQCKPNNDTDQHAVAVVQSNIVAEHLPRKLSCIYFTVVYKERVHNSMPYSREEKRQHYQTFLLYVQYCRWKIFCRQTISLVKFSPGFIFITITTRPYTLTPFIRRRKYFLGLILVIEGDRGKFFLNENFPIYGISQAYEHARNRIPMKILQTAPGIYLADLHKSHVDLVYIRPLLAIHFHTDKVFVKNLRNDFALKAFPFHHMAPVTSGIAH